MNDLSSVSGNPSRLKEISAEEMEILAQEIRQRIIEVVSANGGHLASNLGVVELTIALHRVFTLPPDKIIWDVGHQSYTHKLLTGRNKDFDSLRQYHGISGFPAPEESITDIFHTGHAGTAVSSATGLITGQGLIKRNGKIVAVIGDGSLTNGLTLEGLNFLGSCRKDVLVILNDNQMSISPTKGAISYYLTKLLTSPLVTKPQEEVIEILERFPMGRELANFARDAGRRARYLVVPGAFFETLGMKYFGPIDGHDLKQLIDILENIKRMHEPILLHVVTKKGKGYSFAEKRPAFFHSASRFDSKTGKVESSTKMTPGLFAANVLKSEARRNKKIVFITAAMEGGVGFTDLATEFPDRFFDVGIAEEHAVVFAAGLAKAGLMPVVAIYSTFLQRACDQIFHDICLQKLPVLFLVDRAGIVGPDGPTHHGNFDISLLRIWPGIRVFAPYSLAKLDERICEQLNSGEPAVIRYPRNSLPENMSAFCCGEKQGKVIILGCGSMAENAYSACKILRQQDISAEAVAIDEVKPLPERLIQSLACGFDIFVAVEENSIIGGFGSAVLEYLSDSGIRKDVLRIGIPDIYVCQGERKLLLHECGLSAEKIAQRIQSFLKDYSPAADVKN